MSLRTIIENANRRYGVVSEINGREIVYRFYTPSVLHPGKLNFSLRFWRSKSGAYKALREFRSGR